MLVGPIGLCRASRDYIYLTVTRVPVNVKLTPTVSAS